MNSTHKKKHITQNSMRNTQMPNKSQIYEFISLQCYLLTISLFLFLLLLLFLHLHMNTKESSNAFIRKNNKTERNFGSKQLTHKIPYKYFLITLVV